MPRKTVIVLSTADIDAAVWTNKQHIAMELAKEYDVIYIQSMGLRSPTLNLADLRRVTRRVVAVASGPKKGDARTAEARATLKVVDPRVLPFHRFTIVRRINGRSIRRQIRKALDGRTAAALWSFSPLTYGLAEFAESTIYHSVDFLHSLDGVPAELLLASERQLVAACDAAIASSSSISDHLSAIGAPHRLLWENVADVEQFSISPPTLRSGAVFAGHLTVAKINIPLLQAVADAMPVLHLAGPIAIDGSDPSEFDSLLSHPSVHYHGNLNPEQLAELLNSARVGLVPYELNRYTSGVFPMKLYEYMASGLSVVSTRLPSISHHAVGIDTCSDTSTFVAATIAAADQHSDSVAARVRTIAAANSWTARGRQARQLVSELSFGDSND